ncbi:CCR4-NOT transcription complex subunit 6-like-B isoform X3 [Panonychus citri]|nr:CCR4-NOT transcription complex subunit 6-like-B isoform X3 [Panonychus citri]XP_053214682.1 CCR4-NOT transcription complex subunit 6-like-B isoform X3 [Panonychus citri]
MSKTNHRNDRDKDKYESPNPRRVHTIMSQEDVAAGKKSFWPELEITGTVRNLSPNLWSLTHLTSLYLDNNNLSRIPSDICKLTNLIHLDLSNNKLRTLPSELGDLIKLRELLLNNNSLRVLPYELGKLFKIANLGLDGNPLTQEILVIYKEPNGVQKLLEYLLDNLVVNHTRPPQRPWISLGTPDRSRTTSIFTVMCYNVLCDKYATRQMYGYCPKWAMKWEYRRGSILNEIRTYTADIISLQELETEQFYNYFLPELKRDGYDGIFSPKSRAKTMSENERKHVDGCAIFYRTNKFTLIKEHLVEFNQLAMANAEGSDDMLNRVMTKDNIGLAALLQTKEGAFEPGLFPDPTQAQHPILVCTAHIHWDPEYCDVKLIQTMMLMAELRQIVEDSAIAFRPGASKPDANNVPLILCGDLNSLPNSGVIEYLSNGRISADHADFKELGYKDSLKKLGSSNSTVDNKTEYLHPFKISRAYQDDVMPYTNYTFDFKGVIDYIFYSKQHMSVLGLLGPLDVEWFKENKVVGCPHPHVPSDHFPLIVEFELTPPSSNHIQHSNGILLRR